MKLKSISKLLTIGVLLNSISFDSFANAISEYGRYETFEGSNITINNILEEDKVNIEIEGNTLVNIGMKKSPITSYCSNITLENNVITGVSTNPDDAGFYFEPTPEAIDMMRGKTITIFVYGAQASDIAPIRVLNRTKQIFYGDRVYMSTDKQDLTLKAEIPENIDNTDDLEIIIMNPKGLNSWTQIENKLMILEGDWTNKKAPSYFEGMKSVGELEDLEITSTNKDGSLSNSQILHTEPLRRLPNGVKDRIIKKNGKWYIERNCKEVIFDGTEDWVYDSENGLFRFYTSIPFIEIEPFFKFKGIIADSLLAKIWWSNENKTDNTIYYQYRLTSYAIIKKEFNSNVEQLKEWIRNNNIRFVGQLKNPIYEPIDFNSLQLYLDTTHISTNSIIPPNLKTRIDRVMNRAVEYTELAKTNPTIENLSKARYWNNLLKNSTKKDQLQEEVNNITNISDMVLDRKLTTSNLDVYIKSENILQMSLDTNSISFDDFSGIEDVEKINAVNLTINSSLPYQINTYLPTEIQNSDKTKTLDKSILNIKENSESAYQIFSNTTDKIVLKDNCSAGNQLTHGVDLKLAGGIAHEKDVYKATIKLEAEQK